MQHANYLYFKIQYAAFRTSKLSMTVFLAIWLKTQQDIKRIAIVEARLYIDALHCSISVSIVFTAKKSILYLLLSLIT